MKGQCKPFMHKYSHVEYISFACGSMEVKVCLKCAKVKKASYHVCSINDVASFKLDEIRDIVLGTNWRGSCLQRQS